MKIRFFIDRIEGDMAVVLMGEDESVKVDIPVKWLPKGVKEGMAFRLNAEPDENDTDKRNIRDLIKDLGNEP